MEELYLKDIVSDLIIKFLFDYYTDKNYIFPNFSCWNMLYAVVGEDLQDTEDDEFRNSEYPFDLDREGYKNIIRAIPYMLIEKVSCLSMLCSIW